MPFAHSQFGPVGDGVVVRTPAKLNLYLELLGKRADGYHEIETVMVAVSCFDTLRIERARSHSAVRLVSHWWPSDRIWRESLGDHAEELLTIADDDSNLIHRAVMATKSAFEIPDGYDIVVRKRIPAGAGMGGASSDAAAAILAVTTLAGIGPTDPAVGRVAASIGRDVPFFLGVDATRDRLGERSVPSAVLATGRGERLTEVAVARPLWFVVAYPRGGLSTATVYAHATIPTEPGRVTNLLDALTSAVPGALNSSLLNRLSHPAEDLSPAIGELLSLMRSNGLAPAQMTGSGSACFHPCFDRVTAERKAARLRRDWARTGTAGRVWVMSSVDAKPRLKAYRVTPPGAPDDL